MLKNLRFVVVQQKYSIVVWLGRGPIRSKKTHCVSVGGFCTTIPLSYLYDRPEMTWIRLLRGSGPIHGKSRTALSCG